MRRWWRFKRNRANVRKKKRQLPNSLGDLLVKWVLPMGGIVAFGVFVWVGWRFLHHTPMLAIRSVTVEGDFQAIKPDQLIGLVALEADANSLFIDLTPLVTRLKQHPWVKTVRVERLFPHTLSIRAIEQEPIAILAMPQYYYVNREGEIFKPVESGESLDYPIFILPANTDAASLGEVSKKETHQMIDFLSKYEDTRFAKLFGVSEVVIRAGGYTLFTKEQGMQVEVSQDHVQEELWKLDHYHEMILAQNKAIGVFDLQIKGKIIASARFAFEPARISGK